MEPTADDSFNMLAQSQKTFTRSYTITNAAVAMQGRRSTLKPKRNSAKVKS